MKNKPIRPKIGQQVTATDRLCRVEKGNRGARLKTWTRSGDRPAFKPEPVSGIYIGYRTKYNGLSDFHPEYIEWIVNNYFEAWLIVESYITNPVFVLPDDVTFKQV